MNFGTVSPFKLKYQGEQVRMHSWGNQFDNFVRELDGIEHDRFEADLAGFDLGGFQIVIDELDEGSVLRRIARTDASRSSWNLELTAISACPLSAVADVRIS